MGSARSLGGVLACLVLGLGGNPGQTWAQDALPKLEPAAGAARSLSPLTLQDALELARRQQRVLESAQQGVVAARLAAAQADRNPTQPELNFELGLRSKPDLDLGALVSVPLERPSVRQTRKSHADLALALAQTELERTRQHWLASTAESFFTAVAAQARVRLAEAVLARDQRVIAIVRSRQAAGDGTALELLLAEAEQRACSAQLDLASGEQDAAFISLRRQLGSSPDAPLPLDPDALMHLPTASHDARSPNAPGVSPLELEALALQSQAAQTRLDALKAGLIPEAVVSGGLAREEGEGTVSAGISFSFSSPSRLAGALGQARAERDQAQASRAVAEEQLQQALAEATARFGASSRALVHQDEAERLTRQAIERALQSFEAGETSFLEVLAIQREADTVAEVTLTLRLEHAHRWVRLISLQGAWK